MAKKKKQEEASGGAPGWMATFADLMNLLLCFFVLLFSMSSVDESKYNQLVESLAATFSIFPKGSTSLMTEGELVNMGTAQLNELDEYFTSMGQTTSNTGEDIKEIIEEAIKNNNTETISELISEMNKEATTELLDKLTELTEVNNLEQYMTAIIDQKGYQYVEITIPGSVLFDSGSAEIKKEALPVFSKIADVLKVFDDHMIEIIGHTDNVKIKTSKFPDNMVLSQARAYSAYQYLVNVKKMDEKTLKCSGRGETEAVADNTTTVGRTQNRRIEIRIYNTFYPN